VWTVPSRHRLMKLRLADNVTIKRGTQIIAGTITRLEPDGFWIMAPDGMSYRFTLPGSASVEQPSGSSEP
jgi:hypothetical protein